MKYLGTAIAGLSLTLGMSVGAYAAAPNYDYLELDFIADGEADARGFSTDYDGFGAAGMKAVGRNMLIGGGIDLLETDRSSLDPERYHAGFGLRHNIALQGGYDLGLYGLVSYERLELADDDGNGLGVRTGARFQITPRIEINPQISYADYGDVLGADVDGWTYGLRGLYQINQLFAVSLALQQTKLDVERSDLDLEDEIRIGGRYYFQ